MPQINDIRELAQQNARYVSNSPQDWMSYLDVAARLYRYSFTDALLIHAQRPDATACAELELWNQKMSRWVNRGAKGIALLDDTGPRTRLRYVFDIADTHLVRGGKTPLLWNLDSHEHEQAILDHLADTYGLSQTDSMNTALMELAQQLTADNLDEAMDGLAYEVADTFLEELDEDNIRVRFRELMTNSIFYTLSRRCGQEPMDVLDDDDFIRIVDFNKLPVLSFLGNAVSEQCEAVLFDIGREMRKIYKKEITQQLEKSVDSLYNTNTDFSTLKHEIEETTTKGGQENGVDVLPQGRLSVPESGREGRAADHREVRDAAQDVPEREPQELVSEYADERQTEPASGADRGSSGEPGGKPAGQPEREVSGTEQGAGPAGMGSAPEQPDGDGRGDRLEGIGVQLTETTTEQDLSEAEEEIASAFSFPDLPTVEQQIRVIEAPIRARYADEIALDSKVVDEILRMGSNRSKGQLRLIYNFMVEKTPEEYTEFVKNEYGTGGKGFEIDGAKYAVWFDDLGLRIAAGDTAKGGTIANAFLSWEDVSNRIHELLRQGEYAPQAVLDAARQNALQEHAQTLAYMERDLADGVAEEVFQDTEIFRGGFPELTDRLADLLDDTDFLTDLNERLSALGEAYAEDKDLMRMHFYKPDKVAALFQQFAKPYQNFAARDGFHWNEYKKFITEDEINAYFTRGSNYSDSRLAIYSFFLNHEDKKERADFLKDHYGIGGSSHALCGADDSHEDHDGRGISLERGPYGNPDASVHLNWNQAAGRIDRLIRDSEYLKPADYSRMPVYEREQMAMRVMGFYHHLPNEVERPYPQDLYHEEGRKVLVEKLADPVQSVELLEQMDNALLSVPLDSGEYERKAESLSILHQYVEGTYTIFPEKKRAVEIAVPEQGQISMFDFMEQEPQSKEHSTAAAVEKTQKDAPLADEKYSEQTLQPLPLDAANEYNALKEHYPDALVGYEQYGNFEFYGEDAKRVSELLGSKLLEKKTAFGKVEVAGFPREQWVSQAMKLWKQGESIYLSGQQEDGTHAQTKYFRREEYLPVNTTIELDDREFRVDSVDFGNGTVSLQDMTLAKEARYPIFRTEQLEYIRHLYEQADVPMEEAVEITVFTALHNAGVAYEDFSPEQMDVIYSVAESGGELEELLNPDFPPEQMQLIADVQNRTDAISRAAAEEALEPLTQQPMTPAEVNHARRQHNLPLDSGAETEQPAQPKQKPINFRITDDDLGAGGPKTKYKANVEAIRVLQTLDAEQRQATAEEQEILSRYVGWGGIPQVFDENNAEWSKEYAELQSLLTTDEYKEARASTLNAFYTSPTVIKAMYEALGNMGLSKGNVLEPSCGVGNFMGLVPDSMEKIRMYGVELDSISGRIAQQLYQKNKIAVQGFETMQFPDSFFDCIVGNVPFGNYKVPDKRYDRHNFLIHDYFIAKSLDLVRPGGVVAVVTSSGTMDKKDSSVREYLANRADLVGAIRLPNNAFQRNANTSVVADILFLQKRDRAAVERADWVDLGETPEGYSINQYFAQHPEMVLGEVTTESTQYGKQETTVKPIEGADLAQQLKEAVGNIHATITEPEISDDELDVQEEPIPADPSVKNFSFTNVDGQIYYRENSFMNKVELPAVTAERVLGMYLGDGAVDQVVRQYGMERVGYILANTLHHKSYDGRFSHSNKEWAEQVSTPEHNAERMTFRTDWVVDSHPAILDGFVTMYRDELEAQKRQEQPFVKQFYVVENLQAAPLKIERFGNLDDAMAQYQALPNHCMKALGVEKNPDPLPGSLDILQCRNGIDTIVEDYKTVPGWDNPYIQNHVVQPLQGALAVQDVELAYELPDAYFHIQTYEDGFDYTLYNKDFTERDGGILETDGDKPVQEAMTELLAEFGCDAAEGKVMDAAELREQADTVAEQQAEVLKEKLAAERPVPEETLSFYVAECLEFTFAGEFHDHLTMLHVRFIAINDDFDNIRQSDVDSLAVPIKNMVNSLYAKDISKKISLSYQMRREKGIPTSWCTPYGYQLNQQGNKFEATEDAKWVKLIYQWYLAGVSTNEIARRLEFLEVARPNERLNRKLHEGDDPTYNKWHPSTVLRILNSSAYIGELVSGKTQTASYKGIGLHQVEKKEWHIVENAHEAIILKSDFEKVQARREQNKEKRERAMARSKATREKCYNHLSGMVYCGCCRRNMTFERRVHGTVKETHYGVFICKRKKNTTPCAYHAVPEKMLMMVAMDQIHHLVSTMCEEEKLVKDMMRGSNLDSARSIKMKENSILFRIQEAEERRLRLYEDYKAEILDEDEYSQLKEHYIAEKQRLEHELQKQRQRALELEKRIKICDAQMERMRGILNQNEFDEELVHELIKRIYVGMDNSVEVEFKCSDPYQEVLAIMSEVQNE